MLRQFLGFTSYYRKFIKDYSQVARPLNDLLIGHQTNKKGRPKKGKKGKVKPAQWTWGEEQQNAREQLIEILTSPPILAYADYKLPFFVNIDASGDGLGAVLYQNQNGIDRVIAYASRTLRAAEKLYPAHKREFLALKWAVTDKFHDYLYGNTFEVRTDNNPLTYVLGKARLDATSQRWIAALASYNFSLVYRCGKSNVDADSLSRVDYDRQELFSDAVKAICDAVLVSVGYPSVESILMSQSTEEVINDDETEISDFSNISWADEQKMDQDIAKVVEMKRTGRKPTKRQIGKESTAVRKLLNEWDKLVFRDGILYRKGILNGEITHQLIVPVDYREVALKGLHDDAGHQGRDRTLYLVKSRFYWPGVNRDVEDKISSCPNCILRKTKAKNSAELVNIETCQPLEMICIDFLSLEQSKGGYENILVITGHFTRYALAIPTRNQTAQTTAK